VRLELKKEQVTRIVSDFAKVIEFNDHVHYRLQHVRIFWGS